MSYVFIYGSVFAYLNDGERNAQKPGGTRSHQDLVSDKSLQNTSNTTFPNNPRERQEQGRNSGMGRGGGILMEMCPETTKSLYQSTTVLTDGAFYLLLARINSAQAPFQTRNDICAVDLCNRSSFVFGEGQTKRASVSPQTAEN